MNLLFRVEAGPEIGLGHLRRSLSLATALKREGVRSAFLTNNRQGNQDYVSRFGFTAESLLPAVTWTREELRIIVEVAARMGAQAVVVDSMDVPAMYLAGLMEAGLFVIVMDDLARYAFPAHIVINGNADAHRLPYVSSSGDTLFLLGSEYVVLPEECWSPPKRVVSATVKRIVVMLGGADAYNLMPRLIQLLDRLPGDFGVTTVLGPFFRNRAEIEAAVGCVQRPVKLVDSPHSVYDLVQEADLAISAAGQTLYELARVGCPTIAVRTAANQNGQLKALVAAGAVRDAGCADDGSVLATVGQSVSSLLADREARMAMGAAGQELVDGQGALRVAHRIWQQSASERR